MQVYMVKMGKEKKIEKGISLISEIKDELKRNKIVKTVARKYGLYEDLDSIIDGIAMFFGSDFPESGKTTDGRVGINDKFLDDKEKALRYAIHEFTHVCQHIVNEGKPKPKASQSNKSSDYLDDPNEQEAFGNFCKQLEADEGEEAKHDYICELLNMHNVPKGTKRRNTLERLLGGV